MKLLWKCTLDHDGDRVAFVLARSKNEAAGLLAAYAAGAVDVEPVDHRTDFFVTFDTCFEKHGNDALAPHWHAIDECSNGVWSELGDPEPPPPPEPPPAEPDDDDPLCAKCGHARFASVHHPAYSKPNKCEYEAPAQTEPPAEPPAEVGPERPTSE